MRAYRFVAFLGDAIGRAGRAVADAAHVEFDHSGGLAAVGADTPSERVGQELLRQTARELDTTHLERVAFTARALAPVSPEKRATPSAGGDLGVLFQTDLPGYQHENAVLVKSLYTPVRRTGELEGDAAAVRDQLGSHLEKTPAVYLALVDEQDVVVVSGHAATGIQDAFTRETLFETLYAKSLGRFAEEFAEGFLGDPTLGSGFRYPAGTDDLDRELRAWASEYGLQGVLLVRVSVAPNREPSSLRDFV